ncbi:MAG: helix-turn-helix domain-containing protein [Acidobacteria bacterium]|nr:helix-turn-helix domain-containing protein [Acidobacteriota bacterium]
MEPFGARLKQERERRGITLDEIALSTKIGTRLLRALEEEHFDQLPGGIFNKGFVRSYARYLGLDEDQAVADYLAAAGISVPPPEAATFPLPAASEIPVEKPTAGRAEIIPWGWFAVGLMVLAFGFAVWGFYTREAQKSGRKTSHARETATQSAPSTTPEPAETIAPVVSDNPAAAPPASPAGTFSLLIKAREDSWLSLFADGSPVMEDTLAAGSEKLVEAHHEITLKAGNIGGLDFWFNGQKLPGQGEFSQVKTLTFRPDGLQNTPSTPSP